MVAVPRYSRYFGEKYDFGQGQMALAASNVLSRESLPKSPDESKLVMAALFASSGRPS